MLQKMFKTMCAEANIKGCKTNHSLRATAATQMFQQGVPEKLIMERTGHRSLEGLRSYERLCEPQHRAVSSLLSLPSSSTTPLALPGTSTTFDQRSNSHSLSVVSSNLQEKQVSLTIQQPVSLP